MASSNTCLEGATTNFNMYGYPSGLATQGSKYMYPLMNISYYLLLF